VKIQSVDRKSEKWKNGSAQTSQQVEGHARTQARQCEIPNTINLILPPTSAARAECRLMLASFIATILIDYLRMKKVTK
jgi:hypothetical protein